MAMSLETIHVVQSFNVNEFQEYGADEPRSFKSEAQARERAQRIFEGGKPVIAFSRSGDPKIGEYGEPIVLVKLGEIPPEVLDAFCGENS